MYGEKEMKIEELEAEYAHLGEIIKQKKQDEADRKKAELALEKETRKKELDEAKARYYELLHTYLRDYHSYENFYNSDNSPMSKIFELFM